MSKLTLSVLGMAVAVAATPAMAADAFTSFSGANGAGGFYYGSSDGVVLTPFTTNGSCALNSPTICLHSATDSLPQASIGGTYSTVAVPATDVLLHPGNSGALSVYGAYTAASLGTYGYTINLKSVGKDTTDGVGYQAFTSIGGVVTLVGSRGTLPTYQSSAMLSGTQLLAPGESFGVLIDRNSVYYGDSTALSFSIGAVPEPATWVMMLLGFGMVGYGLRYRRKSQTANVSFA